MAKPKYMRRRKTVDEYDQEYDELITHAVNRYADEKRVAKIIKQFLSHRSKREFGYANVHSRKIFRTQLKASVARHWPKLTKNTVAFGFFTFVHKEWVCTARGYLDLEIIKRKVRRAMGGVNYVAVIEHAFYVNEYVERDGKEGKMICLHVHAIAWDTSYRQLERRRAAVKGRFTSPFASAAKPVHLSKRVTLDDAMDSIEYVAKMNLSGYRTQKDGQGQRAGKMSYKDHYSLFRTTHDRSLFAYWFAGGEGSGVLREARDACLGKRPEIKEGELADLIDAARKDGDAHLAEQSRQRRGGGRAGKWRSVPVKRTPGWQEHLQQLRSYELTL